MSGEPTREPRKSVEYSRLTKLERQQVREHQMRLMLNRYRAMTMATAVLSSVLIAALTAFYALKTQTPTERIADEVKILGRAIMTMNERQEQLEKEITAINSQVTVTRLDAGEIRSALKDVREAIERVEKVVGMKKDG
jgi:septal ring factor EnvC (AmiA/AmiB activator)